MRNLSPSKQFNRNEVVDYIFEKYKYLINIYANKFFIIGADRQDVIQEAMIGLFKAINDFDISQNVKFSTFASVCISRQISKAIDSATRLKNQPLNNYVSIYDESDSDNAGFLYEPLTNDNNPLSLIIDNEKTSKLFEKIQDSLSTMEKEVFGYMMDGFEYRDIIDKLDKPEKSIDNCIQRIKKKARKIIEEDTKEFSS